MNDLRRRLLLATFGLPAVAVLQGCRASLPTLTVADSTTSGRGMFEECAAAHGLTSLTVLHDLNVSYAGNWHPLVAKIQPTLVDAGFRGGSEERLLMHERLVGQSHQGPKGHKQVVRSFGAGGEGAVQVWFNEEETHDEEKRHAAALVVDGYGLFLLGPLWLLSQMSAGTHAVMDIAGTAYVQDGPYRHPCDLLQIVLRPGIGMSPEDHLLLYVDQSTRLMRRVRFTLNGLESTRGALVEVDTLQPINLYGLMLPTRFHERLLRPAPLKVHDWRLTGIDINRGYAAADIAEKQFSETARAPARKISTQ